jgi:hypothetical protein
MSACAGAQEIANEHIFHPKKVEYQMKTQS